MSPIARHYERAASLALAELERRARTILKKHRTISEFVMGMGVASFIDKSGNTISLNDRQYFLPLRNFLQKWDESLKLTGTPMRFTANGKRKTYW